MIGLVLKLSHCWLYALLFAPKVPSVGSHGRKPVGWVLPFFRFGDDCLGRRQSGDCGFAAEGFWWRLAAFLIASPHPLSKAFFIEDYEGSWRGAMSVGGADCEASRRNADAAATASRLREPPADEFEMIVDLLGIGGTFSNLDSTRRYRR